jgi:hypothetical protein
LIPPEHAAPVVASHDRRVLVVGAGGDRGVPPLASTVAPDCSSRRKEHTPIVYSSFLTENQRKSPRTNEPARTGIPQVNDG